MLGMYYYYGIRTSIHIYNKYSTLPCGISINIAPKVGIFPEAEAEVNIHYQGYNIIDIPQGRVEYLFYYIGQVHTTVKTYLNTKAASFWTLRQQWTYSSRANLQQYHRYRHITDTKLKKSHAYLERCELLLIHFTVQIFKCVTVGTDLYSYELTWISEYNEVPVFIYPCFN